MSEQLYRKIVTANGWSAKTWNDLTSFNGDNIWTDGTDIYYSNNTTQYVLNRATSTWSIKTWNGFTPTYCSDIWTDGTDVYYSYNNIQRVFNKATSTWSEKTWNGLTSFSSSRIWTDGTNIYYSKGSDQYVLDKATSTWSAKTWNGLTNFYGDFVWTDGDNIYYSDDSNQYILDKTTSTWSTKTWNGFTPKYGIYIWTDGTNIYYNSNVSEQYVLDKATSTWSQKTWNGLTRFDGRYIWTDESNIYYSKGSDQYVLDKIIAYEPVTVPESMKVKDSQGIWHTVKGVSVRTHGGSTPVAASVKLDTKVPCLTANGEVIIMYDSEGNILAHKSDIGNVTALTRFAMYEIKNIYIGETCPFDTSDVNAEQVSSIYVDGDGYLAYNDVDDPTGENPRTMLEWNSLNEATIDFASIAGYPRYT